MIFKFLLVTSIETVVSAVNDISLLMEYRSNINALVLLLL